MGFAAQGSGSCQAIWTKPVSCRHEYILDIASAKPRTDVRIPDGFHWRAATLGDAHMLAELMLDAYRNTIDYEGEGIAEAIAEVNEYFSRASKNLAVSDHSVILVFRGVFVCACLLEFWQKRSVPFVSFIMCRSTHKRQGLATVAIQETIGKLRRDGWAELRTIITEGNVASEFLFAKAGFNRVH